MSEIATWSGAGLPFQIDYSRDALENIRQLAVQGLMDLPKVGLGVGGVLLGGERRPPGYPLLDSFELPCSHALGPSFTLTPEEQLPARNLIAKSDASRVIGWYWSKGVRPLELTGADRRMLDTLFPERWFLGLLLQPQVTRPTSIVFVSLDSSAELLTGEQEELAAFVPSAERPADPIIAPPTVEPVRVEPRVVVL
jgi:hypothetical protein